jgi:mono/diheme cytochrome c family protein
MPRALAERTRPVPRARRGGVSVALALGVLVGTVALASCASGPPVPTDPELAKGHEVYSRNCAPCHGIGGGGGSAPRLIGVADRMSEQQQIDTITNGVDGTAMPAWGERLSAEEIAAVAAYSRTLTAPR